jgi:hypothetical protein
MSTTKSPNPKPSSAPDPLTLHDAEAALADAKTLASQIKTAWASNKLVPSDSRKHLDSLLTALDAFKKAIDDAVAAGLASLGQLRMKLLALNPHQAAAGKESTGPITRTAPADENAPVVVGIKPRKPA